MSNEIKVDIISTIWYAGRVLAAVEIEDDSKKYKTLMYRSTGSNVAGKDMWFPFSGIEGPEALKDTGNRYGWIQKDLLVHDGDSCYSIPTLVYSFSQHADPVMRLKAFPTSPFPLMEVSVKLHKMYEKDKDMNKAHIEFPASEKDIGYMNSWIKDFLSL